MMISYLIPFLLVGCNEAYFKESKTFAGGKVVSAETLNRGRLTYIEYCVQCHGEKGDGAGVSSAGSYPPPRNFTTGIFKFANVVYGEIPHDEDLHRIIKHGLNGTAMLPWDISEKRLDDVVQYIKTFAPQVWEGNDKALGTKIEVPADPYGQERLAEAIERGKRVYHITAACTQCHRGYETKADISAYNKELNNEAIKMADFDINLYNVKKQESEFGYQVIPPDFTFHPLRSITDLNSIVVRLMYGVNGSGMPGWKDVVADDDLWALAYYVQSLREIKGTPARHELIEKLKAQ